MAAGRTVCEGGASGMPSTTSSKSAIDFLNIVLRLDFVGTNPGVAFQILLT
jgi:hypothetical protein